MTINDLVKELHPLYVGICNPKTHGAKTNGDATVEKYVWDCQEKILYVYIL